MSQGEAEGEDPLMWLARRRRRAVLRLAVIGVVLAVAGIAVTVVYRDFATRETIVRDMGDGTTATMTIDHRFDPRVIGISAAAVGIALLIAAIVMHARRNRPATTTPSD